MSQRMTNWLLFLVAAIAIGYSGFWWVQGNLAKKNVEASLARLNANAAQYGQKEPFIAYDGIELSGYPMNTTLSLTNPRTTLPASALIQSINALPVKDSLGDALKQDRHMATWVEKMEYKAPIVISAALFRNRYSIEVPGYRSHTIIDGKEMFSMDASMASPLRCDAAFAGTAIGLTNRAISKDTTSQEWVALFRSFDCSLKQGMQVIDASTKAPVVAMAENTVYFEASEPRGEERDYHLIINAPKTEYGKGYDVYMTMLDFHTDFRMYGLVPVFYSASGPMSVHADIEMTGPADFSKKDNTLNTFKLNIKAMDMKNNLMEASNRWQIDNLNSPASGKRTVMIKIDSKFRYLPEWDVQLKENAPAGMQRLMTYPEPGLQVALKTALDGMTEAERADLLQKVVPTFSRFGTWRYAIDANADITPGAGGSPMAGQQSVQVKEFAAGCDLYGIAAAGSVQNPPPATRLNVQLRAFDRLIDEAVAYARGIRPLLEKVMPVATVYIDNQPLIDGVKTFVTAISQADAAQPTIRTMSVESAGGMPPTISGKSMAELMQLAQEHVLSKLTPAQPAPADSPVRPKKKPQ